LLIGRSEFIEVSEQIYMLMLLYRINMGE